MSDRSNDYQKTLADLARVKALFQQRSIVTHLGKVLFGSKPDQIGNSTHTETDKFPTHAPVAKQAR